MSYILDALKKSDNSRKQGEVPDLQTVHMPALNEEPSNKWLYLIIVLLLVSLAFLIGVYQPWKTVQKKNIKPAEIIEEKIIEPKENNKTPANIAEPEAQPETKDQIAKADARPAVQKQTSEKVEQAAVDKKPELEISQEQIRQVPRLSELSELVQQAIPNMVYAGHVYSSNSKQRSIIINGYAMSEGDTVIDGLKVKQITPDGVIFDYQGQLFRVEILQDWSFD